MNGWARKVSNSRWGLRSPYFQSRPRIRPTATVFSPIEYMKPPPNTSGRIG